MTTPTIIFMLVLLYTFIFMLSTLLVGVDRLSLDKFGGGGLTHRFCIFIIIGMQNIMRFCPLFAGILF